MIVACRQFDLHPVLISPLRAILSAIVAVMILAVPASAQQTGSSAPPPVSPPATAKPDAPAKPAATAAKPDAPAKPAAAEAKPDAPAKPAATAAKPDAPAKPAAAEAKPDAPAKPAAAEAKPDAPAKPAAEAKPDAPAKPAAAKAAKPKPRALTVASWGGAYASAQERSIFKPFAKTANLKVTLTRHGGVNRELTAAGATDADVIDVSSATLNRGCASGALLPLEGVSLEPAADGASAAADFLEGGLTKCGVASMAWSHVILANSAAFKKGRPASLKDVFDTKGFPGKRAIGGGPRYILELALLADGAKPKEVYGLLASDDGLARAFAKLDTLNGHVIKLGSAAEAAPLLASGKAAFATAFSGRAFRMISANPKLAVIWDGQVYDVDYWVIPKGAGNADAAKTFIRYATSPARLAANAQQFPYGPMRKSAVAMTGKHAVLGVPLAAHLPTSPQNLTTALRLDSTWWAANETRIKPRFDAWLANAAKSPSKPNKSKTKAKK